MSHFHIEDDKILVAVKERLSKTGRARLNRLALPCLF